jgi:hypothetical protein
MTKLIGRKLVRYGRGAYANEPVPLGLDRERVETTTTQVVALGRWCQYGDSVPRLLARLKDGEVVQLSYADQEEEVKKWLRKRSKKFTAWPRVNRECAWGQAWEEGT